MPIRELPVVKPLRVSASVCNALTYEQYAHILNVIASGKKLEQAGIFDGLKERVQEGIKGIFGQLKGIVDTVKSQTSLGVSEIVAALQQKDIFKLLKAAKFNIKNMLKALQAASGLLHKGLVDVFRKLEKSGALQKLQKGTMKVDALLDEYPLLKKIGGIAIAGLLIYLIVWKGYSTGNPETDLDMSSVMAALAGHYSVTDLFTSADGLAMISMIALGFMGAPSIVSWASWAGNSLHNLCLALIYSGAKISRDKETLNKLKSVVKSSVTEFKEHQRAFALIDAVMLEADRMDELASGLNPFKGKKRPADPKRAADKAKLNLLKEKIMKMSEKIKDAEESQKPALRANQDRLKVQVNEIWKKLRRISTNAPYKVDRTKVNKIKPTEAPK
jgi:hypothetical protein